MIRHVVRMVRTRYSQTVPIIIRMDSGFFDQDIFAEMKKVDIGFICGYNFYSYFKAMIEGLPEAAYDHHFGKTDEDVWQCFEFGDRRQSWNRFYRTIFWRPLMDEKQFLLRKFDPAHSLTPISVWAASLISSCVKPDTISCSKPTPSYTPTINV